jgi:hypothetical protein
MTVNHYTTEEVQTIDNTGQVYRTSTRMSPAAVPDEHPQEAYHKKKDIFRSYQATWYIVGFIEFLLGFRDFCVYLEQIRQVDLPTLFIHSRILLLHHL